MKVTHITRNDIVGNGGIQLDPSTEKVVAKVDGTTVKINSSGELASHEISSNFNGTSTTKVVNEVALKNGLASIQAKIEQEYCPHMVGDILYTMATYNPATRWSGTTWRKIEGRIVMGTASGQSTGLLRGSETKTLSVANMPPHNHIQGKTERGRVEHGFGTDGTSGLDTYEHHKWYNNQPRALTSTTGNGTPFDIMPPTISCHIWQRLT